jgi:GT2 family glycosyltransferase
MQHRQQVLDAIEKACEGYEYDLDVGEANDLGWRHVVDQFNRVASKVVAEGYDLVLIVESDVAPPPGALQKLVAADVDVASAVVKYHRYSNQPLDELYKDLVCVGYFLSENRLAPIHNASRSEIEGKTWTFKTNPLMLAGTGCILIKRRVFEKGTRFICNYGYASYDVFFWRDIRKAGFNAVIDGNVFCEHLGE